MNKLVSVFVIVVLCLSVFGFIQVNPVRATVTYKADDFESFPTGNGGWTHGGVPNDMLKSAEQKHGGSYSIVCNTTSITQYSYFLNATFGTITGALYMGVWIYPDNSNNSTDHGGLFVFSGYNATKNKYGVCTQLNYNGTTGWYSLLNCVTANPWSAWNVICNISGNAWHHIEVYSASGQTILHYYVDGIKQGGDFAPVNTNNQPTSIRFADLDATWFMGKMFWDDLTIDDSVDPESYHIHFYTNNDLASNYKFGYNETVMANNTWLNSSITSTNTIFLFACTWEKSFAYAFDSFYINGTRTSPSNFNPMLLTINASYEIECRFWIGQRLLARAHVENGTLVPNSTIWFDGNQSWDYGGLVNPFFGWYWGDGSSNDPELNITSHIYSASGTYNVTFWYYDDYSYDSFTFPVTISDSTDWYIAPGFILGFVCFLGVGFVFIKKRKD